MLQTVLLAAALVIPMHVVPGTHGEPRLGLDVDAYHFADGRREDTPEMFGGAFPGIIGIGMQVPPRGACCSSPIPALANAVGRRYVVRADLRAPELTLDPDDAAVQDFDMSDVGPSGWPQGCITIDAALACRFAARGAVAHLRLGNWDHDFTAGRTRIRVRSGGPTRIIVR